MASKIKRFLVSAKPTEDGFAEFLCVEKGPEGEDVCIARVQHHLTKKAKSLAQLFLKHAPQIGAGGEFKLAMCRKTPLSESKADKETGPHAFRIGSADKKRVDFRILVAGRSKLEGEMWCAVALAAADTFQKRDVRRGRGGRVGIDEFVEACKQTSQALEERDRHGT